MSVIDKRQHLVRGAPIIACAKAVPPSCGSFEQEGDISELHRPEFCGPEFSGQNFMGQNCWGQIFTGSN
jgi:hypothetical protein